MTTTTISGIKVPTPEATPLPEGVCYWVPDLSSPALALHVTWQGANTDYLHLYRGLVHLDKGAAELHALALLSFTANPETP